MNQKNFLKLLPVFILGIFLVNFASAMTVYGGFTGGSQSKTITTGDSAQFSAQFVSMSTPMTVKVELFKAGDATAKYTFLNQQMTANTYHNSYTITSDIYKDAGTYEVRISGTDTVNSDYDSLALTVQAPTPPVTPTADTTAPVITITGSNPATVQVGSTYTDAGATATDNVDGDLTGSIQATSNVDTTVIGAYSVIYKVSDAAGNLGTAVRIVNVVDTTAPVITLTGANPESAPVGSSYLELGATATDNYDGNLTGSITIDTSALNMNVVGSYTITYSVSDSSGNTATATRTVNVIPLSSDTTAPSIEIIYPTNGTKYTSSVTSMQVIITDANLQDTWYTINNDGDVYFSCTSGVQTTISISATKGDNILEVHALDRFGNEAEMSISFKVGKTDNNNNNNLKIIENLNSPKNPENQQYSNQFQPITAKASSATKHLSLFERIIQAIINFFKALFGIK